VALWLFLEGAASHSSRRTPLQRHIDRRGTRGGRRSAASGGATPLAYRAFTPHGTGFALAGDHHRTFRSASFRPDKLALVKTTTLKSGWRCSGNTMVTATRSARPWSACSFATVLADPSQGRSPHLVTEKLALRAPTSLARPTLSRPRSSCSLRTKARTLTLFDADPRPLGKRTLASPTLYPQGTGRPSSSGG